LEVFAPAVYAERWTPVARVAALWAMAVIIIIVVRVPLPAQMPSLPDLLTLFGF